MSYKNILVHMGSGERTSERLKVAIDLAKTHSAHLTGIFCQSEFNPGAVPARKASNDQLALSATVEKMFNDATSKAGVKSRWIAAPRSHYGEVTRDMILSARHADLTILGQHDRENHGGILPEDLAEQVVLNSGRPILVIPYAGTFGDDTGSRSLIAWNGGREAARALNDAMPILENAKKVTIFALDNQNGEGADTGIDEVHHHLSCHGVDSQTKKMVLENIGVMDMVLSTAAEEAYNMLVMGAHGNYGFLNLSRGSGTRYILQHMTLPVLLSH